MKEVEVLRDNFFKGKSKGDFIKLSEIEIKQYLKAKAIKVKAKTVKQK